MILLLPLQNFIFPIIMIFLGFLDMTIFASHMESNFGYKSYRSRLNKDNWKYSQVWMGKTFVLLGTVFLILTLLLSLIFKNSTIQITYILNIALILLTVISSFLLEKQLKKFTL